MLDYVRVSLANFTVMLNILNFLISKIIYVSVRLALTKSTLTKINKVNVCLIDTNFIYF